MDGWREEGGGVGWIGVGDLPLVNDRNQPKRRGSVGVSSTLGCPRITERYILPLPDI